MLGMTAMKIIDMHCDTISELFHKDVPLKTNSLHIDLDKLKSSSYLLQNFALFIPIRDIAEDETDQTKENKNPLEEVLQLVDCYYKQIEKNESIIAPVYQYNDILKNEQQNKISAFLTVEEGGVCKGNLSFLRILYRLGVRMMTLTWNFPNEIGYPNLTYDPDTHLPNFLAPNTKDGLTEQGFAFLDEMEQLGMIIDVSHLSDAGFYDVLNHTKKPFVASHSNSRAVCPSIRNLTDDMIRALGNRGSVTGLNFCNNFLYEDKGLENTALDWIVLHAKHIKNIGGIECLGLGSDFDGIPTNEDIPSASYMPVLYDTLKKAGFTSSELDLIFYKNVLRVYKEIL